MEVHPLILVSAGVIAGKILVLTNNKMSPQVSPQTQHFVFR